MRPPASQSEGPTLSNPPILSGGEPDDHPERGADGPRSSTAARNIARLNVTPTAQNHGTTRKLTSRRHTRRNNSGDLQTLHPFDAAFDPSQVVQRDAKEKADHQRIQRKQREQGESRHHVWTPTHRPRRHRS